MMPDPAPLTIWPLIGLPEIAPGTDLADVLATALATGDPQDGDVLVITQKIVSKAEGRLVEVDHADGAAKQQLIQSQSRRVLRRRADLLITETHHGFICANAGVDLSNVPDGTAALLPLDPDRSARRIRDVVRHRLKAEMAVIISDTFGRPWRQGVTDVAIGCAGVAGVIDLRGTSDARGRELLATQVCIADEIAGAAELVMGKDRDLPAAVVRGVTTEWLRTGSVAGEIVRPPAEDLFR